MQVRAALASDHEVRSALRTYPVRELLMAQGQPAAREPRFRRRTRSQSHVSADRTMDLRQSDG